MLSESEEAGKHRDRVTDSSRLAGRDGASVTEINISSRLAEEVSRQKPCKFFVSKQPCPFGRRCKFSHSSPKHSPSEDVEGVNVRGEGWRRDPRPVCRWFVFGSCKFGDHCKFQHPASPQGVTEKAQRAEKEEVETQLSLLDVASFPGLSQQREGRKKGERVERGYQTHQTAPMTQRADRGRHGPPELSLDAFFQKTEVMQTRPHMVHPQPKKANSTAQLRQVDFKICSHCVDVIMM